MRRVFLSYSIGDEREAAVIRDELRQNGLDVWWDAELPVGSNWAMEIGRALQKSDSMVVLVSPGALASDLVSREIQHALSSENFRNRVFPVFIKDTPQEKLPGYFELLPKFDLTKSRTKGLREVVAAIKGSSKRPPVYTYKGKPVRLVVRAGSTKRGEP
jgi:hypothetical protein